MECHSPCSERKLLPRLLYPARLSFRSKDKEKLGEIHDCRTYRGTTSRNERRGTATTITCENVSSTGRIDTQKQNQTIKYSKQIAKMNMTRKSNALNNQKNQDRHKFLHFNNNLEYKQTKLFNQKLQPDQMDFFLKPDVMAHTFNPSIHLAAAKGSP